MKKTIGTLLIALLVIAWLVPVSSAQAGDQQGDQQETKKQNRRDQPQRRQQRGGRRNMQADDAPRIGDIAPTFTLKSLDGESATNLAEFKGKRPVVLLFGSYT